MDIILNFKKNNNTWTKFQLLVQLGFSFLFIIAVGLAAIASASFNFSLNRFDQSFHYFTQQLVAFLGCLLLIGFMTVIKLPKKISKYRNYNYLKKDSLISKVYMFSILLLILVPIFGEERNGAKRWIFGMQPSEFIKIAYILYGAKFLSKLDDEETNELFPLVKKYLSHFILLAALPVLIIFQSDLGTIIHYMMIFFSMIVLSKFRLRDIVITVFGLSAAAVPFAIVENYRLKRIGEWVGGLMTNGIGGGYQVEQSVIGLGNGGLLGTGYGNGIQKYQWLPEIHTDFIFASIGEEWGFLATVFIILAFVSILVAGIRIAIRLKDNFAKYLVVGIIFYIIAQALMNMWVVTGLMPVTGIPLPLISYGRSSLISISICIGILFNVLRYAEFE